MATTTLFDQLRKAGVELTLARRDGSAEWIARAVRQLDDLIDQIPREAKT